MPAAQLPPEFTWHQPSYTQDDDRTRCLMVGGRHGVEVALVSVRADEATWLATVNRHLGWDRRGKAVHQTREHAMRMVERWVASRADQLLAASARRGDRPADEGASNGVQAAVERPAGADQTKWRR